MTDDPAFGFTEDDLRTQPTVFRGDLFAGKTVLVSGAGSGLGKATAALFARMLAESAPPGAFPALVLRRRVGRRQH